MRLGNIPQAFPYQGSKRKLALLIVECIPRTTELLLEPFAGSAAVSMAAAWLGRAKGFWLNDTHAALMSLWERIIHDPQGLAEDYRRLWHAQHGQERDYYNHVRSKFNSIHKPELLLYLLARCVKAAVRYNRNGEFNNSPDNRRKGMRPDTMARNIRLVSEILGPDTKTTSQDYTAVLKNARNVDLVYMDPPYQGVCKDRDCRYVKGVNYDEFVAELEKLNERHVPFIVSYDGRTGNKTYGKRLPDCLELVHAEVLVGRSTQSTLLGLAHQTYESLYVSPAVVRKIGEVPRALRRQEEVPTLF
jgi:DNA adenine methylase